MRNREWYEDSIQTILCECLPQLPKSNIRPAYSKSKLINPFAKNHVDGSDSMKDGMHKIKNTDNVVYFWLHFDPLDLLSTEISDTVSAVIPFRLTISCYGIDSMPIAIRLKAFMRTEGVLYRMLGMNATLSHEPTLTTFEEELQGEWWERTDVDIGMNVLVDDFFEGDKAAAGVLGIGEGYSKATDGNIIVEEVGDGSQGL